MLNSVLQDECKLRCYLCDQIPAIWWKARPFIEIALNQGSNYTLSDIYEGLCNKQMQLWMWGDEAALVTAIQTKAGKKFCLLLSLGGSNMSDWFQYLPLVEAWAKDEGAEEMRLYGRPAWSKITGYKIDYVKMVKSL